MLAMSRGEVELEPEVRDWYLGLSERDARVCFHVDRSPRAARSWMSRTRGMSRRQAQGAPLLLGEPAHLGCLLDRSGGDGSSC